ncbi:unnamed protein product [Trifolium pratense]|uniref:Uncharacterized protein n=1 Tax=Trifolium pratense TaxID=57577 RepID=A0ACB0K571_TRIPR|nr:unnamed protein product [Trifolium pratense]
MEAEAHKEQENELVIQTHALKIGHNQEEHSPKHQQKEDTTLQPEQEKAFLIQTFELKIEDNQQEAYSPTHQQQEETNNNIDSPPPLPLDKVEAIIGYEFKDKHLLEEAFIHITYGAENNLSYERLEYIGDAVLNIVITKEQFFSYPNLKPGDLTSLRSKNVDTEKLARVAVKLGLERYLRHKKPMLHEQIQAFIEAIEEYPVHSNGLIDVPKALADIVESTIGALYIDCDSLDIVWKVFRKLLEPIIEPDTVQKHPLTELNEYCQKKKFNLQFVDLWEESKSIDVFINEKFVGSGTYGSKKEIARHRAAQNALENIGKLPSISTSTVEDALAD